MRTDLRRVNPVSLCLLLFAVFGASFLPAAAQDVFSSGSAGSGGRRTYPTGSQSHQPNDAPCSNPFGCGRGIGLFGGATATPNPPGVYCQQSPGMPAYGPYSHTGTQTPCGPAFQSQQQQPTQQRLSTPPPIFFFYYINGINTPADGTPRVGPSSPESRDPGGSYAYEYNKVRTKLAETDATKLGLGDTNHMEPATHNMSGKDPVLQNLAGGCKANNGGPVGIVRAMACWADQQRAGGGLAAGDIVECLAQSLKGPLTGMTFTTHEIDVIKVADAIYARFQQEQQTAPQFRRPYYFIIVAHSQGNFFAEGVAHRLLHPDPGTYGSAGPFIANNRLGILSLGSPTRYDSLPVPFIHDQIRHVTRADDGIHILDALSANGMLSKQPWARSDDIAPLWPWRAGELDYAFSAAGVQEVWNFINAGLAPLATPFMNAHLLDNYLTDPTATPAALQPTEMVLPREIANRLNVYAISSSNAQFQTPTGQPVLKIVQREVRDLKASLLQMAEQNAAGQQTSAGQAGGTGFPLPTGTALGNVLGDIVGKLLGQ